MYPQSFKLLVRLYPYVLLVIVCELIFGPLKNLILTAGGETLYSFLIDSRVLRYNAAYFLILLAESLLMFKACEIVLGVSNKIDIRWARQLGYFATIMFFLNVPLLLQQLLPYFASMINEIASQHDNQGTKSNILLSIRVVAILIFLFGYCFIGTWLPAIVSRLGGGPGRAFARGRKTFLYVIFRYLAGPMILCIFLGLLSTVYSSLIKYVIDWHLMVSVTLLGILINVIYCWILVMIAWILSKAYLKTKIMPEEGA